MNGALVRIVLRYGVGAVIGYEAADLLAADTDLVAILTAGASVVVGLATEWFYRLAKRKGWSV